MVYADAVQDSSTIAGPGDVTVAGTPPAGCQGFGAIATGATFPYYIGHQTAAEFECGIGTKTGALTFSRAPTSSSNGGALVNFSAGTKDVSITLHADTVRRGLVDPDDAGFDIVLCAGQSNMAGRGVLNAMIDFADARVLQFGGASGDSLYRTIFSGADPLHMAEGVNTGQVGPATAFARAYASTIPTNRRVLLVPCAQGGTAMVGGTTPPWAPGNPGGTLYENAISQANLAVTAALTLFPNSRIVGAIWHQGESDGDNNVTQANYAAALKALIAGFRARVTGAANSWFVIGSMCPEVIVSFAAYGPIDLAHKQVASETSKCAFVAGPTGFRADTWHYTAPGARILGARMALAVRAAQQATGVATPASTLTISLSAASGVIGSPVTVTVGTNNPLTGAQSESVALTANLAGAFAASPLTINAGTATASTTFTPSAAGSATITATPTGTPSLSAVTSGYTVNAAAAAPGAPTIGVATAGDGYVDVAFTAPGNNGGAAITGYTVTSTPGGITATGATSPINVTGLTNGTAYTFTVHATNSVGNSAESAATSPSVTPAAASASFATWSATDKDANVGVTNSNLTATKLGGISGFSSIRSTVGKSAGKWYWENTVQAAASWVIGIAKAAASLSSFIGSDANGWGYYSPSGVKYNNNASGTFGAAYAVGDVIGVALNMDAGTVEFFKNGVSQGVAYTGLTGPMFAAATVNAGSPAGAVTTNFGATAFAYTPPTGFVGLA